MSNNWQHVANADKYLPALMAAEDKFGLPHLLLCRIAYQESGFRDEIVNCTECSSAGCVGLMQLNPYYFPDAGKDWKVDVQDAAQLLAALYHRFKDWQVAVAAYNDGEGNIDRWLKGERALPAETERYVAKVVEDVPVQGQIIGKKAGVT